MLLALLILALAIVAMNGEPSSAFVYLPAGNIPTHTP
jgi:hypothetical protein